MQFDGRGWLGLSSERVKKTLGPTGRDQIGTRFSARHQRLCSLMAAPHHLRAKVKASQFSALKLGTAARISLFSGVSNSDVGSGGAGGVSASSQGGGAAASIFVPSNGPYGRPGRSGSLKSLTLQSPPSLSLVPTSSDEAHAPIMARRLLREHGASLRPKLFMSLVLSAAVEGSFVNYRAVKA